ncbi:MAG TPA: hypothetical protein VHK69_14025 [Chitinophagaceae bacterium]|jgi:hypothetical protein|nr:hypothetical protein [Chitinophagaceae bacterium]
MVTAKKTFNYSGLALVLAFFAVLLLLRQGCAHAFGYRAGSGLGSLADIGSSPYRHRYVQQYADSFLRKYPQYRIPGNDPTEDLTSGYDFLHLTKFYFSRPPREIYCVQWEGTGFISVRFAYDYATGRDISEHTEAGARVEEEEKERIKKRLQTEVLDRIDSMIARSKDSSAARFIAPR